MKLFDPPSPGIQTFSRSVDFLLSGARDGRLGGVPLKMITEFVGVSGIGKTQMCLQLSLCVQISSEIGGCHGGAVYIDTEGGFHVSRFRAMAQAVERHLVRLLDRSSKNLEELAALKQKCSVNELLSNVTLMRVTTQVSLIDALTRVVPEVILASRNGDGVATDAEGRGRRLPVKLIVLDSLAFFFRGASEVDAGERVREVSKLGALLTGLAETYGVAVVVTNHAVSAGGGKAGSEPGVANFPSGNEAGFTQPSSLDGAMDSTPPLIPALGDAWAHFVSSRLNLQWDIRGRRVAVLKKSLLAEGSNYGDGIVPPAPSAFPTAGMLNGSGILPAAPFAISDAGIRDVEKAEGKKKPRV